MANMTLDEAIHCMKSYLPGGDEHCYSCPYYASKKESNNIYTCASKEAHIKAIEAMEELKRRDSERQDGIDNIFVTTPVTYNEDEENYVWAVCRCCLLGEGLRIPRIRNRTEYHFKCKLCGTEGVVNTRRKLIRR